METDQKIQQNLEKMLEYTTKDDIIEALRQIQSCEVDICIRKRTDDLKGCPDLTAFEDIFYKKSFMGDNKYNDAIEYSKKIFEKDKEVDTWYVSGWLKLTNCKLVDDEGNQIKHNKINDMDQTVYWLKEILDMEEN